MEIIPSRWEKCLSEIWKTNPSQPGVVSIGSAPAVVAVEVSVAASLFACLRSSLNASMRAFMSSSRMNVSTLAPIPHDRSQGIPSRNSS